MPIINAPLEMLAAFLIVYVISALSTLALNWYVNKAHRPSAYKPQ